MKTSPVTIARCPEHGLHGEREDCFVCGGPVEQVAMVPVHARRWWQRKPKPEPIDYMALMQEATLVRARTRALADEAATAACAGNLVRLDEINATIGIEHKRMREIAVEIGALSA